MRFHKNSSVAWMVVAAFFINVSLVTTATTAADAVVKLNEIPVDLKTPAMETGTPSAGKRIRQQLEEYLETDLFHALYLPTDWQPSHKYPVIFEYPGNGPYQNNYGDTNSGFLEHCNLGYGVSGGKGFIWVCLPFVSLSHKKQQRQWWGDTEATVKYCQSAVDFVCEKYGGDRSRLVLAGFSRGAIACNYIGLHDDETAKLWRAFIAHSHYDGVLSWPYVASDPESAKRRLARLHGKPQFISHETSVKATQDFLKQSGSDAPFTFVSLPFPNHTDTWVLRDIPERAQLRNWLTEVLK